MLRRRLVAIATICALWMIEVIRQVQVVHAVHMPPLLWYLYYVPMTLIPLLCQLCGSSALRAWSSIALGRRYCAASCGSSGHPAYSFLFSPTTFTSRCSALIRASDTWSSDYTYGWGYFACPRVDGRCQLRGLLYPGWPVFFASNQALYVYCCARTSVRAYSLPSLTHCAFRGRGGSIFPWYIASFAWWSLEICLDSGVIPLVSRHCGHLRYTAA